MNAAAILLADVVNGADVRMIQGRGRFRFAAETLHGCRIAGKIVRQEFHGHEAVKPCVFGFIDHAHATATEFFYNPVVRDGLSNEGICARHVALILSCAERASQCAQGDCVAGRLVTSDKKEFARVPGLLVEDWR